MSNVEEAIEQHCYRGVVNAAWITMPNDPWDSARTGLIDVVYGATSGAINDAVSASIEGDA